MKTVLPILTFAVSFTLLLILIMKGCYVGYIDLFEGFMATICVANMFIMGSIIRKETR